MNRFSAVSVLFWCFLLLLPISCVSKKKHLATMQTLMTQHKIELEGKNTQLSESRDSNLNLRLKVAEKTGENNALVAMQDKLEGRIEDLKLDLKKQGQQSQSSTNTLSKELEEKEKEIARLKGLLAQVDAELEKHRIALGSIANDARSFLSTQDEQQYAIVTSNIKVKIIISESLLFKPRTTTSIASSADYILQNISSILQKHPNMIVSVTGHTDTRPPDNKGYKNNWTVSAVRAALIADLLASDYNLGPNQILAIGNGEFAPLASNETAEGREKNQRIEFVIAPRDEDTVRILQKITAEK